MKHIQGIHDRVKVVLEKMKNDAKSSKGVDLTGHQQRKIQDWPRKTVVSLWFVRGTGAMMTEILQFMVQGLGWRRTCSQIRD